MTRAGGTRMTRAAGRRMTRMAICLALVAAGCAGRGGIPPAACPGAPAGARCIVAGPHYAAGPISRSLLGSGWREVWTTPAAVPVLDLAETAGGLRPLKTVGNYQSQGLALEGADGRSYTFRGTDKDASRLLEAPLRYVPFVARAYRDQTAAAHPAAPVIAAPIARAAGVLQPDPRLVVMPDDPRLGEFRAAFAGRLGTFEEYPTPASDGRPGSFGALEIVSTDELFARLDRDPAERVDARAYLLARLVDVVLGDVDRHPGNWRWARLERGGPWVALAEDRDLAFVRFGGALVGAARPAYPLLERYDDDVHVDRLAYQARVTDTRLLAPLSRADWQEVAAAVRAALPPEVLAAAVRCMPAPWYERGGAELEALLRERVDGLGASADELYLDLALQPEIHASAAAERVELSGAGEDALEVAVYAGEGAEPVLRRRFLAEETDLVLLCGFALPDRLVVETPANWKGPGFERLDRCELARPIDPPGADSDPQNEEDDGEDED